MDFQEYATKLSNYANILSKGVVESVIVPAANELLAITKNRIINEGKNSEGSDIGQYSRKAGYYSPRSFVNKGSFKGIGKNGGTPRKTMYLANGYYQFRSIQGREVNKVNVNLSGDTMNRYQLSVQPSVIIYGMTTQKASDIRRGNERRFGNKIYASTKQELDNYNKDVAKELAEITTAIFQ